MQLFSVNHNTGPSLTSVNSHGWSHTPNISLAKHTLTAFWSLSLHQYINTYDSNYIRIWLLIAMWLLYCVVSHIALAALLEEMDTMDCLNLQCLLWRCQIQHINLSLLFPTHAETFWSWFSVNKYRKVLAFQTSYRQVRQMKKDFHQVKLFYLTHQK